MLMTALDPTPWFIRLEPVHTVHGRVRLRYWCNVGMPRSAAVIEQHLQQLSGVVRVRVNPRIRSLTLHYAPEQTSLQSLTSTLSDLPAPDPDAYHAIKPTPLPARGPGLLTHALVLLGSRWLPPALQAPIALVNALPVLREAMMDLRQASMTSAVLEALAVLISIGRGDYMAANTTTLLLATAETLEHSIQRRSDAMLKHLLHPLDDTVWVERNGLECLIPSASVQIGDTIIVGTGAIIPIDGTILGGEAWVNEATMTGESVPVRRQRGDTALSGTLVVEGRLRVYAEHVGRHTMAARIAHFVEQALAVQSQTQLQASRMADRLVPMVLGLAGGTALVTGNTERVAAVLQADYSCALKLATPVAFKAALYQAGQHGILVKGGRALEGLAVADTFVFDKTGTLTEGELTVTDSIAFDATFSSEDLINLAASVEEHYFHPLAIAVVEAAERLPQKHHFNHQEVEFIVAHGVASVVHDQRVVVGSRHFLEDHEGIAIEPHQAILAPLRQQGKILLYIGYAGELLGVIALTDRLRSNAVETLDRLRALGVTRLIMLTGDHHERAQDMAQTLGLDDFYADLHPEDKARILDELAADGARVAFVGDGVNDAMALSGAQVGIAMQQGAELARLAADITLLEDNLVRIADAKALALATQRILDSNFRLTVGLNTGILSAAALGGLSPVTASLLHNGSTIAILLRALMMRWPNNAPKTT